MQRPPIEVADVIRQAWPSFFARKHPWFTWLHLKVIRAILRCRTMVLGAHVDACTQCGHRAISYNSCRNRHCPRCQTQARDRWIAARTQELLPVRYAHVVFTLHHAVVPLALQNKEAVYRLLLRASAETLLEVAKDPRHLGAEIGFFSILHTWNQQLQLHPHVHCVIPAGGLTAAHDRWVSAQPNFFLPVGVLGKVFRGKFVDGLRQLYARNRLVLEGRLAPLHNEKTFSELLRTVHGNRWVVYAKRPFGGAGHVVHYLGRYTHRVAISNHRLVSLGEEGVTFRWRDSGHGNKQRIMTVSAGEFLRRFLLHVLPPGFVRIRHFGLFAHRNRRELLPLCLQLLAAVPPPSQEARPTAPMAASKPLWTCPVCSGPMVVIERLTAAQARLRAPPGRVGRL
jgi:predicted Zn-ribbon and HTH transcriptional regulator